MKTSKSTIASYFRDDFECAGSHPTLEKMVPKTRHYENRSITFDELKPWFKDSNHFTRYVSMSSLGPFHAEKYSNCVFLPGDLHANSPYQLKDAMNMCAFIQKPGRILGACSAILFHSLSRVSALIVIAGVGANSVAHIKSIRFLRRSAERRPSALVHALGSFKETYEIITSETPQRLSHALVLGFDEPGWTVHREKKGSECTVGAVQLWLFFGRKTWARWPLNSTKSKALKI